MRNWIGQVRAGLAFRVPGTDRVEIRRPMRDEAVRRHDDLEWCPDLDLARELRGFRAVDVADDLITTAATTPGARAELGRCAGRDVVEGLPAGAQEIEPALEVGRRQNDSLDLGGHVRDTPEVGGARPRDAFDDVDVAGALELGPQSGPIRDGGVARHVRRHDLDRGVLGCAPAIEARPVHRTGDDAPLLADLEDDAQPIGHDRQPIAGIRAWRPSLTPGRRSRQAPRTPLSAPMSCPGRSCHGARRAS